MLSHLYRHKFLKTLDDCILHQSDFCNLFIHSALYGLFIFSCNLAKKDIGFPLNEVFSIFLNVKHNIVFCLASLLRSSIHSPVLPDGRGYSTHRRRKRTQATYKCFIWLDFRPKQKRRKEAHTLKRQ